eukprot:gene39282-49551_t
MADDARSARHPVDKVVAKLAKNAESRPGEDGRIAPRARTLAAAALDAKFATGR